MQRHENHQRHVTCVELLLTLVPGAFLVGDPGVWTSAENHSSPILKRDPSSRGADQRTRHERATSANLDFFTEPYGVFMKGSFHKTMNGPKH